MQQYSLVGIDYSTSYTGSGILSGNIIEQLTSFPGIIETSNKIDFSPITIDHIEYRGLKLQAKHKLLLNIAVGESDNLLSVIKKEIGIFVYAGNRRELVNELNIQITMLWREYAMESDDVLSADAKDLKSSLKLAFKEIISAS